MQGPDLIGQKPLKEAIGLSEVRLQTGEIFLNCLMKLPCEWNIKWQDSASGSWELWMVLSSWDWFPVYNQRNVGVPSHTDKNYKFLQQPERDWKQILSQATLQMKTQPSQYFSYNLVRSWGEDPAKQNLDSWPTETVR